MLGIHNFKIIYNNKNKADSKKLMKEALLLRDWISPFILEANKKACEVTHMENNNCKHITWCITLSVAIQERDVVNIVHGALKI